MIERYLVVASRIRQELADLERVVTRAEQAMGLARNSTEHDFYLDSAALNLHDFYGGLERVFRHIAADVDQSIPGGPEWHRDLLRQIEKAAATFYADGSLSLGKAAQLANVTKQDFLDFLATHNIPLNYDVHELEEDLSTVKEFL